MFVKYLLQGGVVLFLILIGSVIGLAVFIERMIYLRKVSGNGKMIQEKMREKLKGLRIDEAIAVCENYPGPASNIIRSGLELADSNREQIEKAMEDAAKYEIPKLNKNLPILATVVSISTLLGLLGTVLGMIKSSSTLANNMNNMGDLIGGIAQALVTTAGGLIVAIPALVGYNYLVAKIDDIISGIEMATTDMIKLIKKKPDVRAW